MEKTWRALIAAASLSGGSVMMWGDISLTGKTRLVIIGGNLNAERYPDEILQPVAIPYLHSLGPKNDNVGFGTSFHRGLDNVLFEGFPWSLFHFLPPVMSNHSN